MGTGARPDVAAALNRAALGASRASTAGALYQAVADALVDAGFYASLYELDGADARLVTSSFSPRIVRAVERRTGLRQDQFRVALADAPFFRRVRESDQAFLADARDVISDIFPSGARWFVAPMTRVFRIRHVIGARIFAGGDTPTGLLFLLGDALTAEHLGPAQVFAQLVGSTLAQARAAARLADKVAELEATQAQLLQAQKSEAIGRLTGGIAHDFNNLLTPALWAVEQLEASANLDGAQREDVGTIRDALDRCADLTRALLAFGRRQVLTRRTVPVDDAIGQALRLLRSTSPENVHLDWKPGAAGAWVDADVTQLHQVLINLGLNARDAMPAGGVFSVATRAVTRDGAEWVELTCADTGTGIPRAVLPRIFEPFFTTKDPGKGTGLGLSVAEGIVRQHGGVIDVESEEGRGTAFRVRLPRAAPAPAKAPPPAAAPAASGRVLVVEDDPQVRRVVVRTLARAGLDVTSAASLAEARALREAGPPFDLVVTDVVLTDGTSTDETLALHRAGQRVLFITGHPLDTSRWDEVERARVPVLSKPFAPADLVEAVRASLAPR